MSEKEHLRATQSDRGFLSLPAIKSTYGGDTRVYESSAASGPHIWLTPTAPANLNDPEGPEVEAPMHFRLEDAVKLAEQILFLAKNHYQVKSGGGEEVIQMHKEIADIVKEVLRDEDERGGPLQREYPRPIVDALADSIATRVMELLEDDLPA